MVFSQDLLSRTRQEVINEANNYRNYSWTVGENNILDVQKHIGDDGKILATPIYGESDGIDDRMFKKGDDGKWYKSTDNWPFEVNTTYTGEAYAWAGWVGNIQWGGDTTNLFSQRLKDSVNKWIAGAREEDCHTTNIQKIIKAKYKGYTGIDCSGFKISGVSL